MRHPHDVFARPKLLVDRFVKALFGVNSTAALMSEKSKRRFVRFSLFDLLDDFKGFFNRRRPRVAMRARAMICAGRANASVVSLNCRQSHQ